MAEIQSTKVRYVDQNGEYTERRRKLHHQIVRKILRHKESQQHPSL